MDFKNNFDTLSEVSESGTATSGFNSNWGSKEELRDFVTKHGVKDITDLYQDRFKVDRKKLEQMLSGDHDALIPADVFFAKIMEDTDTYITWPNKLKLGAKSKKDPHVRIAGKLADVVAAKERIMTILYTRCNRVTMKMDISFTDHSHIIGRGGLSIKRVMKETQCHVHFPDSNRSNPSEKSNQVSISGDLEGVEWARSRVRELVPLIFGFEPPIMSQNVNNSTPFVIKISEQYKVQIMFRTRSKLHATIVLIKGVEWEVDQVKQATILLMEYMCENLTSQIPVQMSIQISPQHHPLVLGKNHSNLKAIMQSTNCQIMFPDAFDPNIPSLKRSNVNISGNIHNVYNARHLLIGSLPLMIIFDLPEDNSNLRARTEQIAEIQTSCEVSINIRQKTKQLIKACIIKGIERNAGNIYKARNLILGIDEPALSADIPRSYHMANLQIPLQSTFPVTNSDILPTPTNLNPISPLIDQMFSPLWQYPSAAMPPPPLQQQQQQINGAFGEMVQKPQFSYNVMQHSNASSGYHSTFAGHQSSSSSVLEQSSRESSMFSSISSNNSSVAGCSGRSPHRNSTSPQFSRNSDSVQEQSSGMDNSDHLPLYSEVSSSSYRQKNGDLLAPHDFESKRLAGLRAMQNRPTPGTCRQPTNAWSGFGISHTSPAGLDLNNGSKTQENDLWKSPSATTTETASATSSTINNQHQVDYYNNFPLSASATAAAPLSTSNILDHTPRQLINHFTTSSWSDLSALFISLGLERYNALFNKQEVDLATFATLTESDLIEIGVTAFGSRKKMLLAVSELKRINSFPIAPGAERKKSSTSSTPSSTTTSTHSNSPRQNW